MKCGSLKLLEPCGPHRACGKLENDVLQLSALHLLVSCCLLHPLLLSSAITVVWLTDIYLVISLSVPKMVGKSSRLWGFRTGHTMQIKIVHDHNHCHGILKGNGCLNGCAMYILFFLHTNNQQDASSIQNFILSRNSMFRASTVPIIRSYQLYMWQVGTWLS